MVVEFVEAIILLVGIVLTIQMAAKHTMGVEFVEELQIQIGLSLLILFAQWMNANNTKILVVVPMTLGVVIAMEYVSMVNFHC